MIYTERFYRLIEQGIGYQSQASHLPDMNRFIQGHTDYWISPVAPEIKVQKTLVLHDWRLIVQSEIELQPLIAALQACLACGFEMYIPKQTTLLPLTSDNVKALGEKGNLRRHLLFDPILIKKLATQQGIASDDLHLLDEAEVNYLLTGELKKPPLSLRLLLRLPHPTDIFGKKILVIESIFDQMGLSHLLSSTISVDIFSEEAKQAQATLSARHYTFSTIAYEEAVLEPEDITLLFEPTAGEPLLTLESLKHLNTVNLPAVSAAQFNTLLSNLPQLKTLHLEEISTPLTLPLPCLDALEEITGSLLSLEDLLAVLQAAPKLKKMNLSKSDTLLEEPLALPTNSLSELKDLDLSDSIISLENIQILLQAAPKLKKMNLLKATLSGTLSLSPRSLPELEDVDLSDSTISLENIQILLQAAPKLKKMDLSGCPALLGTLTLSENRLPELESLDLGCSTFSLENIQVLLQATPKLKKIDLSGCQALSGTLTLPENGLPELEDLNLKYSNISLENIGTLLQATPKLKKMGLLGRAISSKTLLSLPGNRLSELEDLNLSRSKISLEHVQVLLQAAPKLKKIDLLGATLPGALSLSPRSLPELEDLDLSRSKISLENIQALLQAAPKVQSLGGKSRDAWLAKRSMVSQPADRGEWRTSYRDSAHSSFNALTSTKVDTDTTYKDLTLVLEQVFYPIGETRLDAIHHVREEVYQAFDFNATTHLFSLHQVGDEGWEPVAVLASLEDTYAQGTVQHATAYAKKTMMIQDDAWQALPSLSPEESLLAYHVQDNIPIEISYSNRDNLYYFRTQKKGPITIDFLLHLPETRPTVQALPPSIQAIIHAFLQWPSSGVTALTLSPGPITADTYLHAMKTQRKGACRHRALLFMQEMVSLAPSMPVRILVNPCHLFVEVQHNGRWIRCDLGGYKTQLTIQQTHNPAPPEQDHAASFHFRVWDTPTPPSVCLKQQCMQWVLAKETRLLLETASACDTETLLHSLEDALGNAPFFYIHSPDDLHCASPYMARQADNSGELKQGPGGPLHAFLSTTLIGVLLVNYDTFKAEDIVRFNSMIDDDTRHVDGTYLAQGINIIGVRNKTLPFIPGADFYSRWDKTNALPPLPSSPFITIPEASTSSIEEAFRISLYKSTDWKQQLFGRWHPTPLGWMFDEGKIAQATNNGYNTLVIEGGLWQNPDFTYQMRRLMRLRNIKLIRDDTVEWALLKSFIKVLPLLPQNAVQALNPSTFSTFFKRYHTNETHDLVENKGWIEDSNTHSLSVYLTHALAVPQWHRLLDEARRCNVRLIITPAPRVSFPAVLETLPLPNIIPWSQNTIPPFPLLIQSTDPETTIHQLTTCDTAEHALIIDISECSASDIFTRLNGKIIDQKPPRFYFEETLSDIKKNLDAHRPVILKGTCSILFSQEIAPFLLTRPVTTKLIIVSQDLSSLHYLPITQQKVSVEEKKRAFIATTGEIPTELSSDFSTHGLMHLQAKARFLAAGGIAWDTIDSDANADTSSSHAFFNSRKQLINAVLDREPYVFIIGVSGAGKSTFVQQHFPNPGDTLYQGLPQLMLWVKDRSSQRPLLFLDEANLHPSDWRFFSGLFNNPPTLLIEGLVHPLSPKHKVLFAGNPLAYKKGRKDASFFKVHAHHNTVEFKPLPPQVLFDIIIAPVFEQTPFKHQALSIAKPWLDLYQMFVSLPTPEILITPRELQMMALLTLSYCIHHTTANVIEVARYFGYHLASACIPEAYQSRFLTFVPAFKPPMQSQQSHFTLTESRQNARFILDEHLRLQTVRKKATNPSLQQGGLGGVLLEGEPGLGKSHLIIDTLLQQGFQRLAHIDTTPASNRAFFHMPTGMASSQKLHILRKAFDLGIVLFIDEINTIPLPEVHLNAYLMGKTPEGMPAQSPGFLLLATQNPISMPGRQPLSKALARRMTQLSLPPYTANEMKHILLNEGLHETVARDLIHAYLRDRNLAIQQHYSPVPTFRHLKKTAHALIRSQNQQKLHDFCLQFIKTFEHHTNSTGIKRMITLCKTQLNHSNNIDIRMLLQQMQNIAAPLRDRWLSKQRFFCSQKIGQFGSGRDTSVVQPLYDKLTAINFKNSNNNDLYMHLNQIIDLMQHYRPFNHPSPINK